ncbi:purine nucleoside phosphorylase isoform X1 [Bacillus rossius redtenbacheri]|uniref:purine nucleoside phosphorylase isoform X1 n=1 Tax=Bacillus rossius redtenbacheri TaxID=93214 RepID=UPI002FDEAEDB
MSAKQANGHHSNGLGHAGQDTDVDIYTYEVVEKIAQYLLSKTCIRPKIGIICGSGIGSLADSLEDRQSFSYGSIPDFPVSTVSGHDGHLVFGRLDGVEVLCMQGRFHYYEGYPVWKCAMPVRVMKLAGVTHLVVTNAAGGLGDGYKVGDIMIIKDHINFLGLAGVNPLRGPNDDRFGVRFPALNKAYDERLRADAKRIAKSLSLDKHVHEGVYACVGGPSYETIGELRMMKMMGANAVGMSTVHEVILAKHCNMTVFAFSLITNECIVDYSEKGEACHEDVMQNSKDRSQVLLQFVSHVVGHMASTMAPEEPSTTMTTTTTTQT